MTCMFQQKSTGTKRLYCNSRSLIVFVEHSLILGTALHIAQYILDCSCGLKLGIVPGLEHAYSFFFFPMNSSMEFPDIKYGA